MTDSSVTNGTNFENGNNHYRSVHEQLLARLMQAKSITNIVVTCNPSSEDVYNSMCALDDLLRISIDDCEGLTKQDLMSSDNG